MEQLANEQRLKRIPMDVAAIIGDAEHGDPKIVQAKQEELTALLVQLAASYAAVVTTIGMHREPSVTMARQTAVKQLDKKVAQKMEWWSRMSEPGNA